MRPKTTEPELTGPYALVIGAGPAGLMAAEILARGGAPVLVADAMPSVARKFLRAGIGGLNLTHSEPMAQFLTRYSSPVVSDWLARFDPSALRAWAMELGIETYVGSSGRVFPTCHKAAPLLRAWLRRLQTYGVRFLLRHRFVGWSDAGLRFETPDTSYDMQPAVCVFALGGASWSRLGSDARWAALFAERGVHCAPFRPSNCGFHTAWSPLMQQHAGAPLKSVRLTVLDRGRECASRKGEALIADYGLEGGLIYAVSAPLRDLVARDGSASVVWDLLPDKSPAQIATALQRHRPKDSVSNVLRKRLHLSPAKLALLRELAPEDCRNDLPRLTPFIKRLPQTLLTPCALDEAISTAGGIGMDEVTPALMLKRVPGHFCAGEMLDWEAPTGGYLLSACFASGVVAGEGALQYFLKRNS